MDLISRAFCGFCLSRVWNIPNNVPCLLAFEGKLKGNRPKGARLTRARWMKDKRQPHQKFWSGAVTYSIEISRAHYLFWTIQWNREQSWAFEFNICLWGLPRKTVFCCLEVVQSSLIHRQSEGGANQRLQSRRLNPFPKISCSEPNKLFLMHYKLQLGLGPQKWFFGFTVKSEGRGL